MFFTIDNFISIILHNSLENIELPLPILQFNIKKKKKIDGKFVI